MKYIIFILNIFIATCINAQQIDSRIAEELMVCELRVWNASSDSIKFEALLEKSILYSSISLYGRAIDELERAQKYSVELGMEQRLEYEKIKNYFLDKKYNHVYDILIPTENLDQINKKKEYLLMQLYSLNEKEKWSRCKSLMLEICDPSDSIVMKAIRDLPEVYTYISPEKCKRQSGFLPGLGQITAGYPLKGATSLILQSGLTVFMVYNIYTGFYVTSIVSAALPLLKFYKGGKRFSAILAEERNSRNSSLLKDRYAHTIKMVFK